jgi:hypothetical protein
LEIKPLVPTWPSRPADKLRKERESAGDDSQPKNEERENKKDEDNSPHIDEYA